MSERSESEQFRKSEPIRISPEVFRRIWFETGGQDIWGDASDEELDAAEAAREELRDEAYLKDLEDEGFTE